MDIPRPDQARKKRRRRILYSLAGLGALVVITIGLSRLRPAAPLVENAWPDTVKRATSENPMLLNVRGNGTLVPEEILWIPALSAGRVKRILVLPGAAVKADTVLVELNNPEVEQAAFDAEWQLKGAEAEQANLRGGRQLAHFIEEQRAAVGVFEASCAETIRTRVRARLMPEQLILKNILTQPGAVERDKPALATPAVIVDGAGDEFLAGARFTEDEYR